MMAPMELVEAGPVLSNASGQLNTIFTGRTLVLERPVATGSRYVIPLPPKPPPISMGMTFTWDSAMPRMAAVAARTAKVPCVLVQIVTWPLADQDAVETKGSMYPWCTVWV